ncbi:MAG: sulfatase [Verrucomicrobiota bacterium]|nr:sulfatase [Verrucomicrobiota bacterium]MDG1890617.1 sulfatase [Verrucomicrobiota bacterium]
MIPPLSCRTLFAGIWIYWGILTGIAPSLIWTTDAEQPQRTNVLMITIDDLNDWVECLGGHPQARTPNINALAKRGILFSNAHCQAPVCNPSRVSFMTGVRPSNSGIYQNSDRFRTSERLKDAITLPQHFAANGYVSMGCGKLFHASRGKENFMIYGPSGGQGPLPITRLNCPTEQSKSKLWDWGVFPEKESAYHDVINSIWTAKQLERPREKPFFLGLGFYRPHVPFFAPQRFRDQHPIETIQLPRVHEDDMADVPAFARSLTENPLPPDHAWFVESGQWKKAVQSYLAAVSFVDDCLGRVIRSLDAGPYRENTWIVLFSDHGFFLGEKQRWAKQSLWERATRVPLIMVPPRSASSRWMVGKTCMAPVELLSLYPTLTEICGIPEGKHLDGHSIAPLLRQPEQEWDFPAITTYQRGNHSLRLPGLRYTRYADGSQEIYDLRQDPHEWHNLTASSPLAEDISKRLGALFPVHDAFAPGMQP